MIRNAIRFDVSKKDLVEQAINNLESLLGQKLFFKDHNDHRCFTIMDGHREPTTEAVCYNIIDYTCLEETEFVKK